MTTPNLSDLRSRALDAANAAVAAAEAEHAEATAEYNRRRAAVFEVERAMFRQMTQAILGETLDIEMDPETYGPIPARVSEDVSLTIRCRQDLKGLEYNRVLDQYLPRTVDDLTTDPKDWKLRVVSEYIQRIDPSDRDIETLDSLGCFLIEAADERERREKNSEQLKENKAARQRKRYGTLDVSDLNRETRPFEIVGSPVYDASYEQLLALVRYTDLESYDEPDTMDDGLDDLSSDPLF